MIAPTILPLMLAVQAAAATGPNLGAAERVRVPVPAARGRAAFSLTAFLYRPAGAGRHPLAVLNHGSSGGDPTREVPQAEQARFFTDRGYVVLVPMRRGRGGSGGVSRESEERNCHPRSWQSGLDAAFDDVSAAIAFGSALPDVDPGRLILAGESRGGFLSVAYAAQGAWRSRVAAVVNFVGGWVAQAEDHCPVDFNRVAYRRYGAGARLPQLWLYGTHDRFYSTRSIRSYEAAFRHGGGALRFVLFDGVPGNGHWLPGFPALWARAVDRYLAARGLPAAPVSPASPAPARP